MWTAPFATVNGTGGRGFPVKRDLLSLKREHRLLSAYIRVGR